jgi:outer membrane biosynthesis protein TonB
LSLIDEALKRARQEAARQDAAKRDAQYRQVPVWSPPSGGRSSNAVLIGGIVALCVAAGLGLGLYLGRSPRAETTPPKTAEEVATPTTPGPIEAAPPPATFEESPRPALVPTPAPTPWSEIATVTPVPTPRPVPMPTPAPVAPEAVPAPVESATPSATEPTPTPAFTPPTPAPAEVQSYVREMPLPNGGSLRLDGVAFSASQPVALINGRVITKGESIEGFLVSLIEAKHVVLSRPGLTVHLTLP